MISIVGKWWAISKSPSGFYVWSSSDQNNNLIIVIKMKQYCLNIDNIFTQSIGEKLIWFLQQQNKQHKLKKMNNQKTTTTTTKSTKNIYIYIRQIDYAHEKRPYGLFFKQRPHVTKIWRYVKNIKYPFKIFKQFKRKCINILFTSFLINVMLRWYEQFTFNGKIRGNECSRMKYFHKE